MGIQLPGVKEYDLIISEKPDSAKRIAEALAEGELKQIEIGRISIHIVKNKEKTYVICSASGHLYIISDPSRRRTSYPVFDTEWYPTHSVIKNRSRLQERLEIIQDLANKAKKFINACDLDIEGETIGYNILRYACGGVEKKSARAKFSTLTRDELRLAFTNIRSELYLNTAEAGRTRHVIDFIWGINLSRALSEAYSSINRGYKTISIGRVQSPTLSFIVNREVEIQTFVTTPYWIIKAIFEKDDIQITSLYKKNKIENLLEGKRIKKDCKNKEGIIDEIYKVTTPLDPPIPFNTGDLQRESYRVFGFSPSQTLKITERLYLEALISYPRTSSQKLPPSIGYRKILMGLKGIKKYSEDIKELINKPLNVTEGNKNDPAHPAIYPTGEIPKRELESRESKIYDLIIRRFFSVFGENALIERSTATISISSHNFGVSGKRIIKEGWIRYYKIYSKIEDNPLPTLEKGERLRMIKIDLLEKWVQPPPRYNQGSLLDQMEKVGIGTKTTRSDVISTLYDREYITGESITPTDMGFIVVEILHRYSSEILSINMTKKIEDRLQDIERGDMNGSQVIEETVEKVFESLKKIKDSEVLIGRNLSDAAFDTSIIKNTMGSCPICKSGNLIKIHSKKTGKRFVGCTNYKKGCKASSPLPQKGFIKTSKKVCNHCKWPIIYVRNRGNPWRLCININCPQKEIKNEMRSM